MARLKFKIKGPDGKLAYHNWRIVEAARVAMELAEDHRGSVILVQTYQGDLQVWVDELDALQVESSEMFSVPEWIDEFRATARRERSKRGVEVRDPRDVWNGPTGP